MISYSPAEQLQPFLDGLRGLGIQDPLAVVVRRPSLLGLSLRDNVQVSLASPCRLQLFDYRPSCVRQQMEAACA